jgi:predicted Zn-dependent protease
MTRPLFYRNNLLKSVLTVCVFNIFSSSNVYAFDIGKTLEDAAKQQIEELSNERKSSDSTSGISSTSVSASNATTEKTPTFNWKNPSKEDEIALGREISGSLLGASALVKNEALQKYVNQVGRWVASQSERADLPWKFGVIESDDINAFSAPGGYVLITKGLYQKLQNEAQLAGVLGHEIAHITKKHQLKVLQKQQLLGYSASRLSMILAKDNQLAKKAIDSGAEISARSLDKEAEFEADRMGMVLATRAGYEPYGLAEVLQTIAQTNKTDNSVALLFKTHPHPDERLAKLGDSAGSKFDVIKSGKTLENRFYVLKP